MLHLLSKQVTSGIELQGLKPHLTISDFPEYATNTSAAGAEQLAKINQLATDACLSLKTPFPIRAIFILGHADVALRKSVLERSAFEYEVSLHRAQSAQDWLIKDLHRFAGHKSIEYMIRCQSFAMGSTARIFTSPKNEEEMKKNRRVEFYLIRQHCQSANCRNY